MRGQKWTVERVGGNLRAVIGDLGCEMLRRKGLVPPHPNITLLHVSSVLGFMGVSDFVLFR